MPDASIQKQSGEFWKFWTGQTISNLGTSFTEFALPLLVFQLTGSALNLAATMVATHLPYLFFGLVIGAWVDRVDRKRLMIATDVCRAVVIATIPILALLNMLPVWWIYGVSFISTTLSICFTAAEFAALPSLLGTDNGDRLVEGNGRIQASYSAASVIGPLLAGALTALVPTAVLLAVDGASFVVSAVLVALIRGSFNVPARAAPTHIRQDVVDGVRYVLAHPVLRSISMMMALVNLAVSTTNAQLVLFGKQRLGASDVEIGFLFSAGSLGVVVLSLVAARLRRRWRFSTVALGALMLGGLLTIAFALTPEYWIALPLWAAVSGLGILFNINTGSLRQAIVPNHLLGRVISVAMVFGFSAIPLGAFIGGLAIEWTHDVALVYAVCGFLEFAIPVVFVFGPLGHAEKYLPSNPPG